MRITRRIATAATAGAVGLGVLAATPALAGPAADALPTTSALPAAEAVAGAVEDSPLGGIADRIRERRAERRNDLAAELGVDVEALRAASRGAAAAVEAQHPVDEDGFTSEELVARGDLFEQTVADELGIEVAELRAGARVVLVRDLDEAVADGRITPERADALVAAFDEGVLGLELRQGLVDRLGPRLEEAVAAGRLTQQEADGVLHAAGNGTLRSLLRERRGGGG